MFSPPPFLCLSLYDVSLCLCISFSLKGMAAEVNGSSAPAKEEEEPMDISTAHTENYQTLIDAGLPQKVAESLDNIFQTGMPVIHD